MTFEDLRVEPLKLKTNHPWAYQPDGCTEAIVTGIFWDKKARRICLMLTYPTGQFDFIPMSEVAAQYYPIANLEGI